MQVADDNVTRDWGLVYVNGELVPAHDARINALDRGLLYGDGIFETVRVYAGKPFMLESHLERMLQGCSVIDLEPPDIGGIRRGVKQVLSANRLTEAYLRITVTRGSTGRLWYDTECTAPTVLIMTRALKPETPGQGLRLAVSEFRRDERSPLALIKTIGMQASILARRAALREGADDAILLNTLGKVAEATSSNVFWTRQGKLFTPSLDCGVLPGITRGVVLDIARKLRIKVEEGAFEMDELAGAEEVFLTNSISEVSAARSVGDIRIGDEVPGPLTRRIQEKYRRIAGEG